MNFIKACEGRFTHNYTIIWVMIYVVIKARFGDYRKEND